ncbi:Thioredoxin reductase 3 [Heterocephalus glaber]|uniref:Thioredoxin reductase 3 n=1 Tax=Heterocephalus glaber TaxID=10181 RepID=G5AT01_HETGA|nr:Thioredoxin reductase 3 [Heterocephalus glaber]
MIFSKRCCAHSTRVKELFSSLGVNYNILELDQIVKHNWEIMTEAIQNHIGSLNWGYRLSLREKRVTYTNSCGEFMGQYKLKATNRKGQETFYTAAKFVIATGERPRYLGIEGDKEYCVTRNSKIPVNDVEQTNVPHIYAIGDILEGKPELTPVAIERGKLLAC